MHTKGKVRAEGMNILLEKEGYTLTNCSSMDNEERKANTQRIASLWNAADGMTTEEAVKYITHGREMVGMIKEYYHPSHECWDAVTEKDCRACQLEELLATLEG